MKSDRPPLWQRIVIAACITAALLIPIPHGTNAYFWERMMDATHLPFFAGVTWLIWRLVPEILGPVRRLVIAMLAGCIAGAATELLQKWTGRDGNMGDFLRSTCGVMMAAVWIALGAVWSWRGRFIAVIFAAFLSASALMPAWSEFHSIGWRKTHFPLLADFEDTTELRLWIWSQILDSPGHDDQQRSTAFATRGRHSLKVTTPPAEYPGVRLLCGDLDWSGYDTLVFDVLNPESTSLELSIRIDDDNSITKHNERYNRKFTLPPGATIVSIALQDLQKEVPSFNLTAVRRVVLFFDHPKTRHVFYLDHMRLE